MDIKQAKKICYPNSDDGVTRKYYEDQPLIDRLKAQSVFRYHGYNPQSAQLTHTNQMLADICEALAVLLEPKK